MGQYYDLVKMFVLKFIHVHTVSLHSFSAHSTVIFSPGQITTSPFQKVAIPKASISL